MKLSDNSTITYLNLGGFDSDEYAFGGTPNNRATGFTLTDEAEKTILRNKQDAADSKAEPDDGISSLTGTLIDAGTGGAAGVIRRDQQSQIHVFDTATLEGNPNAQFGETFTIVVDPTDPAPVGEFDELKKFSGAPGVKPAGQGTQLGPANVDPAAPFPGLLDDPSREARENRVHDLLFGENAFARFSASIGYGPFTRQEAMALRFYAARNGERLQELRDLHGEDAQRIAARAIINVLQENAGQMLPQQHIIDAQFNAALNLALHPDNLQQEFEAASRNALFGPVYDLVEDSIYTTPLFPAKPGVR